MIEVPSGFKVLNPEPLDGWSGPYSGDTESEAKDAALSAIPSSVRYPTMDVVLIIDGTPKRYWFSPGIADVDLKEVINQALVEQQLEDVITGLNEKMNYKEVELITDLTFPMPKGIIVVNHDDAFGSENIQSQFYYSDGLAASADDLWLLPMTKRSNVLNQ